MKEQAINMIDGLKGFLDNIKSIATHPYSNGVNISKLVADLQSFADDLKESVEQIEEATTDEIGQPDEEEKSE
jgi:hypothetical protein